uniref:Retrovirus-related Pol polyprotein from transposon TNT 1-94 n=1 Tax=Rhabditophanes sp. KR3021 TaxID=114890 RepID=A0AC35UII8_9BILA
MPNLSITPRLTRSKTIHKENRVESKHQAINQILAKIDNLTIFEEYIKILGFKTVEKGKKYETKKTVQYHGAFTENVERIGFSCFTLQHAFFVIIVQDNGVEAERLKKERKGKSVEYLRKELYESRKSSKDKDSIIYLLRQPKTKVPSTPAENDPDTRFEEHGDEHQLKRIPNAHWPTSTHAICTKRR